MSPQWPRGETESERLEFKGRDALKQMKSVARGVVAMLNASGGQIWIGIAESKGVAVEIEPIDKVREQKDALWNHLVDTLDPVPNESEVAIHCVDTETGPILRLDVNSADERKPYSYLDHGPQFVVRAGARVRAMLREELASLFQRYDRSTEDQDRSFLAALVAERNRLVKEARPRYWLRVQPNRVLGLDTHSPFLVQCLSEPGTTGNRPTGWTFVNLRDSVQTAQGHLRQGSNEGSLIRVHRDGWIDFRTPLDWLRYVDPFDETPLIYPYAILERTVSVFRLARTLYSNLQLRVPTSVDHRTAVKRASLLKHRLDRFEVAAEIALIGARGWRLRPYSPKAVGYRFKEYESEFCSQDLLLERPLVFRAAEVLDNPDRCALRLLIPVYESFGFSEDKIPSEFDRASGHLLLPT